jgi:hypothetical protein
MLSILLNSASLLMVAWRLRALLVGGTRETGDGVSGI